MLKGIIKHLTLCILLVSCGPPSFYKYEPENLEVINETIDDFFNQDFNTTGLIRFYVYEDEAMQYVCRVENASGCFNMLIGTIALAESLKDDCRLVVHEMLHSIIEETGGEIGFGHHSPDHYEFERQICLLVEGVNNE